MPRRVKQLQVFVPRLRVARTCFPPRVFREDKNDVGLHRFFGNKRGSEGQVGSLFSEALFHAFAFM